MHSIAFASFILIDEWTRERFRDAMLLFGTLESSDSLMLVNTRSWSISPRSKTLLKRDASYITGSQSNVLPGPSTELGAWDSAPQADIRMSKLNVLGVCSIHIFCKICKIPNCKILVHFVLKSRVLPGPFFNLSVWVGFCTWSPQQGVKLQLWYWGCAL
jgi:hypothetical protein